MASLMRRIIFIVLALALIPLAVINGHDVALYLNPFDRESGGLVLPLIVLLVLFFLAGFICGHLASTMLRLLDRLPRGRKITPPQ